MLKSKFLLTYTNNHYSSFYFFSFMSITFLCICYYFLFFINFNAFALSTPQFPRYEINSGIRDGIQIAEYLSSQTATDYKSPLDLATDIQKVTYYSDGKNLNATLWLGNKTITDPSKFGTVVLLYGALFDIDKNPATGKFGVDFQHEIQWNNYSKEWNSFIVEQSSKDYFRTVFSQENYTGIQDNVNFVLMSQNLKFLTLPEHFKVLYYTVTIYNNTKTTVDMTSWIDIPPPTYTFSTIPDPIVLTPGEQKDIGIQLESSEGINPEVVDYIQLENNESLVKVILNPNNHNFSSFSSNIPAPFRIIVPSDAQVGKYKIPFLVNISQGSIFPSGFIEIPNFNLSISGKSFSTVNSNLTITVTEPLSFDDKVREFWTTYGPIISLVTAGFVGGISTYILDKLRNRSKKKLK
jgi:hypothetical protein